MPGLCHVLFHNSAARWVLLFLLQEEKQRVGKGISLETKCVCPGPPCCADIFFSQLLLFIYLFEV